MSGRSSWWKAVVGVGLVTVLGCAGLGLFFASTLRKAGLIDDVWVADRLDVDAISSIYSLQFPAVPMATLTRSSGFQDPIYETLARFDEAGFSAFSSSSGLRRDATAPSCTITDPPPELADAVGVALSGFVDRLSDGGFPRMYRSGCVFDRPGATWVYLMAFGT